MSTPNRKRRLPEWVSSGNIPVTKETRSATSNGVDKTEEATVLNGPKVQKTRPRQSGKDETEAAGGASSSRGKLAKVSSRNSEDEEVKTGPGVTEDLDAVTETIATQGKSIGKDSTGAMGKDRRDAGGIGEMRSSGELQAGIKEELERRDEGVPGWNPSGQMQTKVKEEPEERFENVYLRKPTPELHTKVKREPEERGERFPSIPVTSDRRNLSPNNESKDVKEKRPLLSESSRKKLHDMSPNQRQGQPGCGGGNNSSVTQQIKSEENKFDEYRSGKQTHARNGTEENDTSVSLATQEAKNGHSKPLVRQFSKLLDGVIFTISGLVNPERAELRKMALDMGAEYRPSWSSDSTLLIAAFANTPSFNQVKAVGGTIVHKDWVVECYKRKELVPIEEYMMHVGNPWRAGHDVDEVPLTGVGKRTPPSQTEKPKAHRAETDSGYRKAAPSASAAEDEIKISKSKVPEMVRNKATRSEIQQWFVEDLETLRSWLEKQHERPTQEMLELTAAQGLVACLEDAVRSLEENKGLNSVLDSWAFIPRAIKELEKELSQVNRTERLVTEAERIKSIYTAEMQKRGLGDPPKENAQTDDDATEIMSDTDSRDPADYNSDDTEDLDEDEITQCQIQILQRFSLD